LPDPASLVGAAQQAQVDLRFDLQRSDHVAIQTQGSPPEGFLPGQVALINDLDPVYAVGELSVVTDSASVTRSPASEVGNGPLVIADPGGLGSAGVRVIAGAGLNLMRADGAPPVVWLGARLARSLGVGPGTVEGRTDAQVVVRGRALSVAGIIRADTAYGYLDNAVVASRPTGVELWGGTGEGRVLAHVRPGSAKVVADYILDVIDPTGQMELRDVTPPDGERLRENVGGDLRRIGAALGLFVGIVGLIAVANTLMMSVHQRTRELGLRSAMGWSRRRIGLLVLAEAAVAGLAAGVVGAAVGLLASAVWCWTQGWGLVVPGQLPLLVIGGGVLAALLGGLMPALRAASVSPMTAMRS
ncbi:MAG: ABC transporter permease, partial [Nocardioidaceae bacterium]|nr:ABC transporter permease [Nocardioidaceae bacterium]